MVTQTNYTGSNSSKEMIETNPFASAGKSGTLEKIKKIQMDQ